MMVKQKKVYKVIIICWLAAIAMLSHGCSAAESQAKAEQEPVQPQYVGRLFDDSYVHTLDIVIDHHDWQGILDNAADKEYTKCAVVIDDDEIEQVGIRAKGNNSLQQISKYGSERFGLKLEFDHYIDNQLYYGLDKLALNPSFQDNAFMKDYFAYDMMRYMGVKTPLCSYVYVMVNGEGWGLFLAVEEVEDAFALRNYGESHGQLYKPDYRSLEDANDDVALVYTGDDVSNYDNIFRNAKFKPGVEDQTRLIRSLKQLAAGDDLETVLDTDQLLRYFVVQSFVVNLDSYLGRTGHNYYLYEKDGILSMIPWDYNLAFGTYMLGVEQPVNDATMFVNYPIDTPAPGEYMLRRPMFHNLMKYGSSFSQYHDYYEAFMQGYFESGHFEQKMVAVSAMIAPYVKKDPTRFCTFEDHLLAVDTLRDFCLLRAKSIRGQLAGEIPSTINGQAKDISGFIDASTIWIPDLGDFEDMRRIRDNGGTL